MREHHLVVRKTARYYTLGSADARELWIVLHGYSQLARRFLRRFRALDDGTRLIAAPEALNRYYSEHAPGFHAPDARIGATWMTKEDRQTEIEDYVGYLDRLFVHLQAARPAPPARTVLLGFSQGVATAARWAARGHARFDQIVFWGGHLPEDVVPGAELFHGARTTFVYGRADAYTPPARIEPLALRLAAAGLPHEIEWFDGGHEIEAAALARIAVR